MRCLYYSLLAISLSCCASEYSKLTATSADTECARRIQPGSIRTSWYDASIDVVGHHISGLLLIKVMPDSSHRVVFTNEVGITYLDFGFLSNGTFEVHTVIGPLKKKAVIRTLRKDFELILGIPFVGTKLDRFIAGDEVYFGVRQKNETAYFITTKDCASLQRIERGSSRRRVVSVKVSQQGYPLPEQLELTHLTFDMQIKLNRIQKE
ncbi:MAG: hypothetical protein ABIS36_18270 [Chryseolinea sp.]